MKYISSITKKKVYGTSACVGGGRLNPCPSVWNKDLMYKSSGEASLLGAVHELRNHLRVRICSAKCLI